MYRNVNLSPSIDLIWRLAAHEMAAGEFREIEPEHFCMALLKFAEVAAKEADGEGAQVEAVKFVAGEAQLVREALSRCGIDSTSARRELRRLLGKGDTPHRGGKVHRSDSSRALFASAAALATESGSDTVTPLHFLTALVQSPTPAIAQAVLGKAPGPAGTPGPTPLPALEENGQDLVRQAAKKRFTVKPGLEAATRALIEALKQPHRKSILLASESDDLVVEIAGSLANALAAKDAPQVLRGKRFIDISASSRAASPLGMRPPAEVEAAELERMRRVFVEAAAHPEVLLLVPAVDTGPNDARGGPWTRLLRQTLAEGKAQWLCRVRPSVLAEQLRKDPLWKARAQAVWLHEVAQGSAPREL